MLTVQDLDDLVYLPETNTIREKCPDCGHTKIVSEAGYAVCQCELDPEDRNAYQIAKDLDEIFTKLEGPNPYKK